MLVGYQRPFAAVRASDQHGSFTKNCIRQERATREKMTTCRLTSLEGCRETETALLGEGILGYAVSEQQELFV
jgi:hypothetical protein